MTRAQKIALLPYRAELKAAYAKALASAMEPGKRRIWFLPYLKRVLAVYRKLRSTQLDGRRLSKALANSRREAFKKLLRPCDRDSKTKSRWAAALTNAHKSSVSPKDFAAWLSEGGGVAGRASQSVKAGRQVFHRGQIVPRHPGSILRRRVV